MQTGIVKTEKYLSSCKKRSIPESFSLRQAKLVYICWFRGLSLPHHDLTEHPSALCWLSDGWSYNKSVDRITPTENDRYGGVSFYVFPLDLWPSREGWLVSVSSQPLLADALTTASCKH